MTEVQWDRSDDAGAMLDFLWRYRGVSPHGIDLRFGGNVQPSDAAAGDDDDLGRSLHRFYLASCRGIWKLLPQEASRRGVELCAGRSRSTGLPSRSGHPERYASAPCTDPHR